MEISLKNPKNQKNAINNVEADDLDGYLYLI